MINDSNMDNSQNNRYSAITKMAEHSLRIADVKSSRKYLNVLLTVRANRVHWSLMALKCVLLLSGLSIPYLQMKCASMLRMFSFHSKNSDIMSNLTLMSLSSPHVIIDRDLLG